MIPILLALVCEYIDSGLGMGYGTILAPLLVLLGYDIKMVVPSILATELVTGLFSGLMHWRAGNTELGPRGMKMLGVIGGVTIFGTVIGSVVMIQLPTFYTKLYMGLLVTAMGLLILLRKHRKTLSWRGISGISFLAAFNKAISGGGYGPVVCGGQILNGVEVKQAIGMTSLAESLTCATALTVYALGLGDLQLDLVIPLMIGSVAAVPLAVLSVKYMNTQKLGKVVAYGIVALGLYTLLRVIS